MNKIILNADWQYYSNYYHYIPKGKFLKFYRMAKRYATTKNRFGVFAYIIELLKTDRQMEFSKVYKPSLK